MLYLHKQDFLQQAIQANIRGYGLLIADWLYAASEEATRQGREFHPSQRVIAQTLNMSRETVCKWMGKLAAAGLVERFPRWHEVVQGVERFVHRMADVMRVPFKRSAWRPSRFVKRYTRAWTGSGIAPIRGQKEMELSICDFTPQQIREVPNSDILSPSDIEEIQRRLELRAAKAPDRNFLSREEWEARHPKRE